MAFVKHLRIFLLGVENRNILAVDPAELWAVTLMWYSFPGVRSWTANMASALGLTLLLTSLQEESTSCTNLYSMTKLEIPQPPESQAERFSETDVSLMDEIPCAAVGGATGGIPKRTIYEGQH